MKIFENIVKTSKKTAELINLFLVENKSLFGGLSEFILINSKDNGKKHFIFCKKYKTELLLSYFSYMYYNESTMKNKKNNSIYKIKYTSENDLEDKLSRFSILSKAINCKNIFVIHEYFGWQQIFNSYVYRNLSSNDNKLQSYGLDNYDSCFEFTKDIDSKQLLIDYDKLVKTIDLLPHNFTLPLLAYCIFSYTKTLYKQYGHKVDITKVDKHFALNIILTEDTNINKTMIDFAKSFSRFTIKEKIFAPKEHSSEIGKIKKPICTDFPVFIYNSELSNSKFKTSIPSSMFHKAVTSNISYIYCNIDKFDDYLLNISIPKNMEFSSADQKNQAVFPQKLLDGYLNFISKTLSYETYKKERERKENLIKKIYDADYNEHISSYIYNFIDDICCILQNKKISKSKTFFLILLNETEKFTMKEFETLENVYSKKIKKNCTDFAQKYYDKHLLKYEIQLKNDEYNSNLESYVDSIADNMYEKYVGMFVNNYLSISKHHPPYFDNLYKKAEKYLKNNLKGKKYDRIQLTRYSFLLAAMISFKEYIYVWLPENFADFNKYYQDFIKFILQMCCTPLYKNIDNETALSEFAAFLKAQIDNDAIIDTELGTDSEIGWIDRKQNKIYLKNTCGDNFYDKFINYLKDRSEHFELSKQAFVRDVLEENGVANVRYAGGGKRFDYERKILKDRPKFRVLILDCTRLNIKISTLKSRVLIFTFYTYYNHNLHIICSYTIIKTEKTCFLPAPLRGHDKQKSPPYLTVGVTLAAGLPRWWR